MRMITSDGKKVVNVGGSDIWMAVYSTTIIAFGRNKKKVEKALSLMEIGKCNGNEGYETARQFNLIKDEFAKIPPEKMVYDINDKKKKAPWDGKISPVITSCGNLFTTSDGDDLIAAIVGLLVYSQIANVDVIVE